MSTEVVTCATETCEEVIRVPVIYDVQTSDPIWDCEYLRTCGWGFNDDVQPLCPQCTLQGLRDLINLAADTQPADVAWLRERGYRAMETQHNIYLDSYRNLDRDEWVIFKRGIRNPSRGWVHRFEALLHECGQSSPADVAD